MESNNFSSPQYSKVPGPWSVLLFCVFITGILLALSWGKVRELDIDNDKVIAFLGATLAFSIAFTQYLISQKWKKTEFLATEHKSFVMDNYVQRVMYMLDYPVSNFQLFDEECIMELNLHQHWISNPGSKIIIECNYAIIAVALSEKYDTDDSGNYDSQINIIRRSFDKFIFKTGLFNKHVDARLINASDLKPYLRYWISVIESPENIHFPKGGKNYNDFKEMKKKLIAFIDRYRDDYPSFMGLLDSFEVDFNEIKKKHAL